MRPPSKEELRVPSPTGRRFECRWTGRLVLSSITPTTTRNDRAGILMVGWFDTKRPIGPANTIISATETTTAAIIIASSSTMPTAVVLESSESIGSTIMICRMTAAKVDPGQHHQPPDAHQCGTQHRPACGQHQECDPHSRIGEPRH